MKKAKPIRVLVVEDSGDDAQLEINELKSGGYAPVFQRVETAEAMRAALEKDEWDAIISDHRMPHFSSFEALEVLKQSGLNLPFIVVSRTIGEETAVELVKAGAYDYVMKDKLKRLVPAVEHALDNAEERQRRREAEKALAESEKNYRNSLDGFPLGIRIINAEGDLFYANKTMLDIYGYSTVDELRQTPVSQRYAPESYAAHLERKDKRKHGEHVPDRYEINIVRKDGETRCLEVIRSEVVWNGKKEFQTIYLDITERRQMEEKLIISDRLASIGELASGVAHELNNPLTSVFGYSELLLLRDLPDDVKEHLGIIHSQAGRAARIVKSLLTFARSHALKKQPTNINEAIQNVLALRRYKQMESNIEVKTQLAANLPEVTADSFQLQQVFMNIVTNAEYFMAQAHGGGVLTINTEEVGGFVRCSFADDGLGISPENIRRLFTPFFTTKEIGKGTGLGMSISHGIVSEHQGRIYARSRPGEGATFIVELPINPDNEGASR